MRAVMVVALLFGGVCAAQAAEVVSFGGFGSSNAVLERPSRPRGSIILMPGGDGYIGVGADGSIARGGNTLVRTRSRYAAAGFATLTIDSGVSVSDAIEHMRKIARPVVIVGMSRGSLKVPGALSARPDGVVLMSAFLDDVRGSVGSAAALPPTLVLHHQKDGCRMTPPSGVEPFKAWGGTRVQVVWGSGGSNDGDLCQARGHHGFGGIEGTAVSAITRFAGSLRR